MDNEILIEKTMDSILSEVDGWSYEDYETTCNRVAHRAVFTPWGFTCVYNIIADSGQVDHGRASSYFEKKTRETVKHFIKRGKIS